MPARKWFIGESGREGRFSSGHWRQGGTGRGKERVPVEGERRAKEGRRETGEETGTTVFRSQFKASRLRWVVAGMSIIVACSKCVGNNQESLVYDSPMSIFKDWDGSRLSLWGGEPALGTTTTTWISCWT